MYYLKYRPQKFSEISKPNDTAHALMNQVKDGKVAHAYLFVGSRGTGKTTTARILAKALNCENLSKEGDPCNECDACNSIKLGNFLDLIEIDAASNRGIDDIRNLRDKIKLAPSGGKQKIYIIDEVHMLTTEAFNALLKTLEEPPEHATFVLCTTEGHKVPDTIKSRCLVFNFKRASQSQLVEKLNSILSQEGIKDIPDESLNKIAQASLGGFRDAETLLQQVIEGGLDVDSFISPNTLQTHAEFVDALLDEEVNFALRLVNKLYEDGVDLHVWTMELVRYLRDLLFIAAEADEGLIDVTDEVYSKMEEQASKFTPGRLVFVIENFVKAQNDIKATTIPQLPLEMAVVTICSRGEVYTSNSTGQSPEDSSGDNSSKKGSSNEGSSNKGKSGTSEKDNASKDSKPKDKAAVKLNHLADNWKDVLAGSKKYNNSVSALLKSSKPVSVDGSTVTLEVFYSFHKERLETPKNRRIVEKTIEEVFGFMPVINCSLSKERPQKSTEKETGELTDYNVSVPSSADGNEGSLLDVFDGALPI